MSSRYVTYDVLYTIILHTRYQIYLVYTNYTASTTIIIAYISRLLYILMWCALYQVSCSSYRRKPGTRCTYVDVMHVDSIRTAVSTIGTTLLQPRSRIGRVRGQRNLLRFTHLFERWVFECRVRLGGVKILVYRCCCIVYISCIIELFYVELWCYTPTAVELILKLQSNACSTAIMYSSSSSVPVARISACSA